MHLTVPILPCVVLRAHQNIDHAEKKKKAVNSDIPNYKNKQHQKTEFALSSKLVCGMPSQKRKRSMTSSYDLNLHQWSFGSQHMLQLSLISLPILASRTAQLKT